MGGKGVSGARLVLGLLLFSCVVRGIPPKNVMAATSNVTPIMERVTHEGDIILRGSETMSLERVNYTQIGHIVVTDNASLRIASSILRLNNSEEWYTITINSSGRLWLGDSIIEGPNGVRVYMAGSANAYLNVGTLFSEGMLCGKTPYYSSGFGLGGDSILEAQHSRLGYVRINDNASCNIRDSFVGEFHPDSPVVSVVEGSDIESMRLWFTETELVISQGVYGYHEYWDSKAFFGKGCIATLRLIDTEVLEPLDIVVMNCSLKLTADLWSVHTSNCSNVRVEDSSLWLLGSGSGETQIEVENSTIDYLRGYFWDSNASYTIKDSTIEETQITSDSGLVMSIENCAFGYFEAGPDEYDARAHIEAKDVSFRNFTILLYGQTTYAFENATIEESFQIHGGYWENESSVIRGEIRFGDGLHFTSEKGPSMSITRGYNVVISPSSGQGIDLELKRGNETIWRGATDSEGRAAFDVTFVDIFKLVRPYIAGGPSVIDNSNMTDTLTLVASSPEASVEANVGLLTDSPIRLELPVVPPEDDAGDFTPYVFVALTVIALIFLLRARR